MSAMDKMLRIAVIAAFGLGGTAGAFALIAYPSDIISASSTHQPVWSEMRWSFPTDQWGKGKAFQCKPDDCGTEVKIYLRSKVGFCNCATGVADDADLDRMSDLDLVGNEVSPLGAGRPIAIGWMKGRIRVYSVATRNPPSKTAVSVAFNDRCDMIVATVVLPLDQLATMEPGIVEFLRSATVLQWAELTLGM